MEQKNKLTPMQEKAINHGKGNALVSASVIRAADGSRPRH